MRRVLIVLLFIVIIAGIAFFLKSSWGGGEDTWLCTENGWVKHGNPSSTEPIGGCGTEKEKPVQVSTTPFSEIGNLSSGSGGFVLVYEEPGKPALRVNLGFVSSSTCNYSGSDEPCINFSRTIGDVGDRVKIDGERAGDFVTVSKMTTIESDQR